MACQSPVLSHLACRAVYTTLRRHHSALAPHVFTWHKIPATLNTIASVPLLRVHKNGGMPGLRHKSDWHNKSGFRGFTQREVIVVCLSLGTFLLYFMYLRQPSDIDEYMNQPIWKRLPGIDPEQAERMMEVDKYLGLQVDYNELEKYKQEYYEKKLEELQEEQRQRDRHQELLQTASSHRMMLEKYTPKRKADVKNETM